MGNQLLSTLSPNNQPSLQLHSSIQHPFYGTVKIYTYETLPMTFLMRLDRTPTHSRLYHTFQQVQDMQHPALTILYGFRIYRNQNCNCPTQDYTIQYWEYLNYSLSQHIQDRRRRKAPLTHNQVWYLIQTVCEVGLLLQKFGLIWQVDPQQMVITPEAKIKCNWSHLQSNNKHLKYYQAMHDHQSEIKQKTEIKQAPGDIIHADLNKEPKDFLSPEEKDLLTERQSSSKINLQKSNSYKLGLLLVYVLTFKIYQTPIQPHTLKKICNQIIAHHYPLKFCQILQAVLQIDPLKRWTLEAVQDYSRDQFNSNFQLLINEGRRQDLQASSTQARMRENTKITRRYINANTQQQGVNMHSQLKQVGSTETNSGQRLMQLRQYRKSLQFLRQKNN